MNWGAGPALGPLTFIGYFLFAIGAALVWRNRDNFSIWVHDEISLFRRNFSRYTTIGPFYSVPLQSHPGYVHPLPWPSHAQPHQRRRHSSPDRSAPFCSGFLYLAVFFPPFSLRAVEHCV